MPKKRLIIFVYSVLSLCLFPRSSRRGVFNPRPRVPNAENNGKFSGWLGPPGIVGGVQCHSFGAGSLYTARTARKKENCQNEKYENSDD